MPRVTEYVCDVCSPPRRGVGVGWFVITEHGPAAGIGRKIEVEDLDPLQDYGERAIFACGEECAGKKLSQLIHQGRSNGKEVELSG